MKLHFKLLLSLLCCLQLGFGFAQDDPKTIKIKRESNLTKVVFDNTDMRLIVVDRFGNPRENQIVSFKLYIKEKRETKEFSGFNNALSGEMINYLNKLSRATKIFFTEINVKDDNDHLIKLPDVIDTWFPNCANCETPTKRRR